MLLCAAFATYVIIPCDHTHDIFSADEPLYNTVSATKEEVCKSKCLKLTTCQSEVY